MAGKERFRHEPGIYQREDGRWAKTVNLGRDVSGRRRRVTVYGADKAEVTRKVRDLRAEHEAGRLVTPDRITVGQFLERWIADLKIDAAGGGRAAGTVATHESRLRNNVIAQIGDVRLQKLDSLALEDLFRRLRTGDHPLSGRYAQQVYGSLKAALQKAVRMRLIPSNPLTQVDRPRARSSEIEILTPEQASRLIEVSSFHRLGPLIRFALETGMRCGEIRGLRWADVDLGRRQLHVRQQIVAVRGGGQQAVDVKTVAGRRTLPLSKAMVAILQRVREQDETRRRELGQRYTDHGLVFCQENGAPHTSETASGYTFARLVRLAGVPAVSFHALRHTCASLMILRGEPIPLVSRHLGHANPAVTYKTYAHLIPGLHEVAVERLAGQLGGREMR